MLYIHQSSCISPQQTFDNVDLEHLHLSVNNQLQVIEPAYKNIPAGVLRRMSKNVKIGIAAALPLLQETNVNGIIIGTANGGMEESIKFLHQIIEYDEGLLTPGDFVQSTANAIASQISLMTNNKTYNSTHVHRGFSFENALLDAAMLVKENERKSFLVGGVDVISQYNYNIDTLAGCYKDETITNTELYTANTKGTIAGEGAAMFVVSDVAANAVAKIEAVEMCFTKDVSVLKEQLVLFLKKHFNNGKTPDILLSGEDGDNRLLEYYNACESVLNNDITIARYKHITGDYATVSAIGVWLACNILENKKLPAHMLKQIGSKKNFQKILLYNCYRQLQHSWLLLSKV